VITVLFVCMGNICRSPMAEAVFKDLVAREGLSQKLYIDSVGTDAYHIGEPAHRGTRRVLAEHGIQCDSTARQVTRADLEQADYIIAMDRSNATDLQAAMPRGSLNGRLNLLLNFTEGRRTAGVLDVPDPYYTGNFEEVFRLVTAGCKGLLAHIRRERGI
jgi:protein-tyrosine phosphatase